MSAESWVRAETEPSPVERHLSLCASWRDSLSGPPGLGSAWGQGAGGHPVKQQQAKHFREIAKYILDSAAEAETDQDRDEYLMLARFYEQSARELELRTKQRLH